MHKKINLLLGLLCGTAAAAFADVSLKNAVIVHPDTLKGRETVAVEDMKTALEKMTGRGYKVFPESQAPASGVKIYIGNTKAAQAAGIDVKKMEPQQFKMQAGNGKVFLAGGTPTGTGYAVSTFLQTRFGVYSLAGDCDVYPKNSDPVVKDFEKVQKPDVTDRMIYSLLDRCFNPDTQKKWHRFHRINRMTWPTEDRITPRARESKLIPKMHSFYELVPPAKYFKTHPEYFSMRGNGQRDWRFRGNLCLSNKEVWQVALKELLEAIKKDRKKYPDNPPTLYGVAYEDNPNDLCECAPCQKREKEDGTFFPLNAEFASFLAREARKVYPDIWVSTATNRNMDNPDVKFELEKNIMFIYCDRTAYSNSMYPLTDPMNKEGYERLNKWRKKVPVLGVWDYFWCPNNIQPMIGVDAIIGDCRLFRDINLYWFFKESEFHFRRSTFLSFHQLQIFLELQLLFDASQDPEKLIRDFINGYYGAAAPEMLEYFTMLRQAQQDKKTSLAEWNQRENRNYPHITYDFLIKSRQLVKQGLAKVKNDKNLSARVSWELLSITASLFPYTRNTPGKEAEFKEYQKEYKEALLLNLEVLDLKPRFDQKARENLAQEFAEAVVFDDLPPELAKLPVSAYIPVPSKYLKGYPPSGVRGIKDPDSSQPRSMVKVPLGKTNKKLLPLSAGVYSPRKKQKVSITIKTAPADEKYHWYRLGVISIDPSSYIHVSWASKLLLKDFYSASKSKDKDFNRYEVWVSIKMSGPGYVPGSTKETGMYIDRGLLVKKY